MFFVSAITFFIITLGIALFPAWQNFATEGGFKLFWKTLQTEIANKEPQLALDIARSKRQSFFSFIKTFIARSFYFLIFIIIFIFVGSFTLYLNTGNYNYLNQPLAKRLEIKKSNRTQYLTIASMLVDRLKSHNTNSNDWKWLGQVLFMAEDYTGSADAFRSAIKYGDQTAEIYADLGEALVMNQNGQIMADAIRAFMSSLRQDRHNFKASYFLALSKWQKNDEKNALAIFKQIVANSDKKNKWGIASKEHIKEISYLTGINVNDVEPIDLSIIARGFEP